MTLYFYTGEDSHSDDSEGEVAAETTEQQDDTVGEVERVPRPMRRSLAELTVGSMYHFAVLCFYVYVHVYDATLMKKCPQPDRFFVGSNSYGGRWKYLTFINLVGHPHNFQLSSHPPPLLHITFSLPHHPITLPSLWQAWLNYIRLVHQ